MNKNKGLRYKEQCDEWQSSNKIMYTTKVHPVSLQDDDDDEEDDDHDHQNPQKPPTLLKENHLNIRCIIAMTNQN